MKKREKLLLIINLINLIDLIILNKFQSQLVAGNYLGQLKIRQLEIYANFSH